MSMMLLCPYAVTRKPGMNRKYWMKLKNTASEFDPTLVEYFFDIYETIKAIQVKYEEE